MRAVRNALCALVVALSLPAHAETDFVVERATSDLAAAWWQWAMALPPELSPVADRTGRRCMLGQQGDTWFLAGGFGASTIRRSCVVPAGRSLFFPLINMVYFRGREVTDFGCRVAKRHASLNNDAAVDLHAEIDGQAIGGLKAFRIASETCFDIYARATPGVDAYNAYPSATDGYWLYLKPLPAGRHVLKFGGRYENLRSSSDYARMVQDIEYELLVE